MKGKHKIEVRSKRIVFTIELERNITILRGDSATGKTTLVEMLSAYENYGRKSGITIVCDKTCRVLSGALWEAQLKDIQDAIVFVDEGSTFVSSLDFARAIQKTDNYYVLVTREDLSTLPYSVNAILELKKTTSRFKRTYNKAYPIRCVQLRKHSKAREKRYSFGYAVSFIFACYQILWTFPKSRYLCSRYLPLVCG